MIESSQTKININQFDDIISDFLERYNESKEPIEVSFRSLVPELKYADRASHLIHTYPAKLLMHIPYFFLNNSIFSKPGDIVLDPFSGSGTVLLESILSGRNALGVDANPLARLISKVKTTNYDPGLLKIYTELLFNSIPESSVEPLPFVCNVDYWFLPHIQKQLGNIIQGIKSLPDEKYRDFFWVCFSNCIKKVSLADPRVSVPVKLKLTQYKKSHPLHKETKRKMRSFTETDAYIKLRESIEANIKRFECLNDLKDSDVSAKIVSADARSILAEGKVEKESVSIIISSPPYAGAQKYIRASSLNLGWLNYLNSEKSLKELENQNIGREHYKKEHYKSFKRTGVPQADLLLDEIYQINPLRSYIASNYLDEMRIAFQEAINLLKPSGYFVLVAANNQVCGKEFKTQEYLTEIVESLGLKLVLRLIDDIKSYGLMTKRNKTANIITREWVLIFQK